MKYGSTSCSTQYHEEYTNYYKHIYPRVHIFYQDVVMLHAAICTTLTIMYLSTYHMAYMGTDKLSVSHHYQSWKDSLKVLGGPWPL